MAQAVADAFRYNKLVLATTTYNGDIFPFMKEFIHHLTERSFQNRTVGFMENGSWAPVAAKVMKVIDLHGATSVILQSYSRIELEELTKIRPYHRARVHQLEETLPDEEDKEYIALMDACKETTMRLLRASETPREEAILAIKNINHPVFLGNFICTNLPFSVEEKAELLEISDQKERAYKLLTILNREYQFAMLKQNIQMQTREELDQQQKEYFLQQQIKNIQSELGESMNEDVVALRKAADKANLPKKARAAFEKELAKLERIPMQAPDYNVQLNYLQTLTTLPWGKKTQDNLNLNNAERQLNRDHYGLEKVKERILEHLAMLRVSGKMKSPIICLYGPPGVGKTSLGKSIATALGRKYVRISLGGVHDEAEIRGHRRTYVGAMPGRIIKALIKAESSNPLFVLDEIDKVSDRNHNGDPQSACSKSWTPNKTIRSTTTSWIWTTTSQG
jgi:ATP-dependent Lon protease